ncbi:M14 family zinc carboxypeptidase [Sphingomonas olei]
MLAATGLSIVFASGAATAQSRTVTDPVAVLKAKPGSDYFLANYKQISEWLQKVSQESDRMKLVSIGKTAEGREQYMAIISSPENIRNLDRYRGIAQQLALAKGLTDDQAKALADQGKAVVWIDAGLHATEVVNAQSHVQLIHEMLTRTDPETMRILNDTIGLYVFANPDGLDLVADWYMRLADKAKRSTNTIPVLYQKYVGHDNNRDSYASHQPETTNMNRAAYREWFPQILYNQHQTGPVARWCSSRPSAIRTISTTSRWSSTRRMPWVRRCMRGWWRRGRAGQSRDRARPIRPGSTAASARSAISTIKSAS